MSWLLVAAALAAPEDCAAPATASSVSEALEASEALFATMDVEGFVARTNELESLLPCVDVPLESPTVARVHRVLGIRAFVERDADLSVRAFAAARRLEPEYRFAATLVPESHPLRVDYTAMDPASSPVEIAPEPLEGRVSFDGLDTRERPTELPSLLQRFDRAGAVVVTDYLLPGDPLPSWPARVPPHPLKRPLLVGTGAGAVATLGLLVGAAVSHGAYQGLDTRTAEGQERLDPLRGRTNALFVASMVAGGLTLGGGGGLAFVVTR